MLNVELTDFGCSPLLYYGHFMSEKVITIINYFFNFFLILEDVKCMTA